MNASCYCGNSNTYFSLKRGKYFGTGHNELKYRKGELGGEIVKLKLKLRFLTFLTYAGKAFANVVWTSSSEIKLNDENVTFNGNEVENLETLTELWPVDYFMKIANQRNPGQTDLIGAYK